MIVREALFALAAIFNSADWFNPANTFGLGGNLLAAALIGLLGILIAGINSQTMRVDYLLTAFLLFAIAFGVKVDVNVEDVQTGAASTVDDVPAGVAYVASLASSASYELAQDLSTALQRPGSETSVMTADGFLNPLKVLLALRQLRVDALDPMLHQTMLAYYRYCVGKTLEQPGSTFSMRDYTNAVDPMAYLTDTTVVQNWMTVEYTEGAPEGVASECHNVAANIDARMGALTAGLDDRVEIWSARTMGSNAYNEGFTLADINDAVNTLFRAGMTGQTFMANQMLSNLHNAGEAWRLAEYGSDKAQYVATLTEAMESQRVEVASEGSIFLQMMFPLMGFFQFLFFALPPIIVLVMLAAPAAAVRILGFYLLFGVWAYGWVPVAAVINHYIQIAIQNDIQFARDALVGSGYTAILGFDSLYNVVATKLTIGANALASVPVILGAILTATPFAISNIAGRMAGGAKINTSGAAPSLISNGPVMQRAALGGAPVGSVMGAGGRFVAPSSGQRMAYQSINWSSSVGQSIEGARQRSSEASSVYQAASQRVAGQVRQVMTGNELEQSQRRRIEASMRSTLGNAYENSVDAGTRRSLSDDQARAVQARVGLDLFGSGAGITSSSGSRFTNEMQSAYNQMLGKRDELSTAIGETVADTGDLSSEVEERLTKDIRKAKTASETAQREEAYAERATETLRAGQQLGISGNVEATDFAVEAYKRDKDAYQKLRGIIAGEGGARMLAEFDAASRAKFEESAPVGIDGLNDKAMDDVDRMAAGMYALDSMARGNDKAATALMRALKEVGGIAVPIANEQLGAMHEGATAAGERVGTGSELEKSIAGKLRATEGEIDAQGREVNALGDGIARDAKDRVDVKAQAAEWRAGVEKAFEDDKYGVRAAAENVDAAIEAAKREQGNAITSKIVGALQPGSGSDAQARAELAAIPQGRGEDTERQAARAVVGLGALMRAQGDTTANPEKVYSDFVKLGWSPKAAAEAAFASAGVREVGGADMLGLGAGASVATKLGLEGAATRAGQIAAETAAGTRGVSAGATAAGRFAGWLGYGAKFAGPVAGAVVTAAGAGVVKWADKEAVATIDKQLQSDLMSAAKQEMQPEEFAAFERYLSSVGGAGNAEELYNRLQVFTTGESAVTGAVGAYPGVGGEIGQRVEVWDERIRGK